MTNKRQLRPKSRRSEAAPVIRELAEKGWTRPEISKELQIRSLYAAPATIKDIIEETQVLDIDGDWTIAEAHPSDDAQFFLTTLKDVVKWSDGRIRGLKRSEVALMTRVHAARPDLQPLNVWRTASEYLRRQAMGQVTGDLDLLLALWPGNKTESYPGEFEENAILFARLSAHIWPEFGYRVWPNNGEQTLRAYLEAAGMSVRESELASRNWQFVVTDRTTEFPPPSMATAALLVLAKEAMGGSGLPPARVKVTLATARRASRTK